MDLREELGKAIDGEATDAPIEPAADVASPAVEPAAETAPAPAEEGNGDGRVRGADGRFLSKAEPVTQETQPSPAASPQAAQAAAPSTEPTQGVDLPPSTWTAAAKAEYAKLPDVVRNELKKRESDYQKGITQYKTAADFGSRIDQVIRPYEAIIRSKGGNPEGVIGNLLDTAYKLHTGTPQQKAQLLLQAAQQYGADMSVFGGKPAEQGAVDQSSIAQQVQQLLQPHLQKIEQVSTQFTSAQQQREQQEQQTLASQIDAFRTATDEKGQPKHVYFENVRGTMAALIDSGDAKTLPDAYEMACRAHPEVSKIVGAEQRQRDEAQRLAEARRLADEARRANTVNAQGQGGVGIADTSKVSLRDELDARLEGRIA